MWMYLLGGHNPHKTYIRSVKEKDIHIYIKSIKLIIFVSIP